MRTFDGGRASAGTDLRAALEGASGLIHATPDRDGGHARHAAARRTGCSRTMWVSEVVYVPLETPLLKAARRVGCATADGGHMNVGQAVDGFKLFTGVDADAARMDAHFRRLVA